MGRPPSANALEKLVLPNKWRVGKHIGSGDQGHVYEVIDENRTATPWVVKLAAKPANMTKMSPARIQAASLTNEARLYRTHFMLLRGKHIPGQPQGNLAAEKVNESFAFFIMERMDMGLFDAIPYVAAGKQDPIQVGLIGARLVEIVEEVHKKGHLLIDIKPENFMHASPNGSTRSSVRDDFKYSMTGLARRLRAVDFGIARKFESMEELSGLRGNAMYASLHMHTLKSSSRRDDIEMALYVFAEYVIRLVAELHGKTHEFTSSKIPAFLPWSQARSDEDLIKLKKDQVNDANSEFYEQMPTDIAHVVRALLEKVWTYGFNSKPAYQEFRKHLEGLVATRNSASSRKRRAPASKKDQMHRAISADDDEDGKMPAQRRSVRSSRTASRVLDSSDDEEPLPPPKKKAAATTRRATRGSRSIATQTAEEDLRYYSIPTGKRRTGRASSPMDISEVDGETEEVEDMDLDAEVSSPVKMKDVTNNRTGASKQAQQVPLVKVIVLDHGEQVRNLEIAANLPLRVGSRPTGYGTKITIDEAEVNHCEVKFTIKRGRVVAATVKDLGTSNGTSIHEKAGAKSVRPGKEGTVLMGSMIAFGNSRLKLDRLSTSGKS